MSTPPTLPPDPSLPPPGERTRTVAGTSDAEETPLEPLPERVGHYDVVGEVARGGMGVVYRARDQLIGRDVAVKVLLPRRRGQAAVARRFVEEARITGQLQHPGVPPVFEVGVLADGSPFLAMKLIKGQTLDALLESDPPPDRGQLIAVFEDVCQTIAYAHSKGVIHRDLKPQNVMVGSFGEVQVMDWGLAKVLTGASREPERPEEAPAATVIQDPRADSDGSETQIGSVLGTPAYMPPEQAAGAVDLIDRRSDVFGLGAILCAALTGKPPFVADSGEAMRLQAAQGKLADAFTRLDGCGADPELVALAKRCLAATPAERPADAAAVAQAVAAFREAAVERARRAEVERAAAEARAVELRKRRRVQAALVLAALLVVGLMAAGAWWQDRQAAARRQERELAVAGLREAVATALDQANDALGKDNLDEAHAAVERAADRFGEDGPADLKDRLADLRKDLDLVRELDRIRDLWYIHADYDCEPDYGKLFQQYAVLGQGVTPEQAAERVRTSRVKRRFVAGLDECLLATAASEPELAFLTNVLRLVDPDPFAAAVRAAVRAADAPRLRELARKANGAALRPETAIMLAIHGATATDDTLRILRACSAAHPTDATVMYWLGIRLRAAGQPADIAEAIGYFRAAIAARPRYANNYCELGLCLLKKPDVDGAIFCFRKAVGLEPAEAHFHSWLGQGLKEKGDLAGAEAELRKAAQLDANVENVLAVADFLEKQNRPGAAFHYLKSALTDHPDWPDPLNNSLRYNAACYAARCGTGRGSDAAPPSDRPALREQAREWLAADLAFWQKIDAREEVHRLMQHWLTDPDLEFVRHPIALYYMPTDERRAWRALWADVRRLRDRTAPDPFPF